MEQQGDGDGECEAGKRPEEAEKSQEGYPLMATPQVRGV
jgi:hypothetical protein